MAAQVRIGKITAGVQSPVAARVRIGKITATVTSPTATQKHVRIGRITASVTAPQVTPGGGRVWRNGAFVAPTRQIWRKGAWVPAARKAWRSGAWVTPTPPAPTPAPVPTVAGYTAVSADDFNTLDPTAWYVYDNSTYGSPDRIQRYMARNALVGLASDGQGNSLQLVARRENVGGNAFTAAMLDSKTAGRYYPRYPRFEARMKIPHGQGLWPSWWLTARLGGATTVELDIMEMFHAQIPGKTLTTLHRTNNAQVYQSNVAKNVGGTFVETPTYTPGWHTIAMEIYPVTDSTGATAADPAQPSSYVRFKAYLDGVKYWDYVDTQALWWTTNGGDADSFWNVYLQGSQVDGKYVGHPDDPFGYSHILNACISGSGTPPNACPVAPGGINIIRAQFPSTLELDYHRVWKYTG